MTVPAGHFLDTLQRRELACALARYAAGGAAGRSVGDPVHEEVTEGRRSQYERALAAGQEWAQRMKVAAGGYHSCGDLAHWLLYRLGCRNERLVNRTADEGSTPWMPVRNITNITGSSAYRKAHSGDVPQPGDILFLMDRGGHLAVLLEWHGDIGEVATADYGQPYGAVRIRTLTPSGGGWLLGGRPLDGWLDLDAVEWDAMPDLTGLLIPAGGVNLGASAPLDPQERHHGQEKEGQGEGLLAPPRAEAPRTCRSGRFSFWALDRGAGAHQNSYQNRRSAGAFVQPAPHENPQKPAILALEVLAGNTVGVQVPPFALT